MDNSQSTGANVTQLFAARRHRSASPLKLVHSRLTQALDTLAPPVNDRTVLIRMGGGRPHLIGVPTHNNHITRSFHIVK